MNNVYDIEAEAWDLVQERVHANTHRRDQIDKRLVELQALHYALTLNTWGKAALIGRED